MGRYIMVIKNISYSLNSLLIYSIIINSITRSMDQLQQICIGFGTYQMLIKVPNQWSVNKLKCLLCCQMPKLQFDKFELKYGEELLEGEHRIQQISQSPIKTITLEIVLRDSREKFQHYYSRTFKPFFKNIQHKNLPILQTDYNKSFTKSHQLQPEPINAQNELPNNQFNDQPLILRLFRIFGFYILIGIVITFAQLYQVGFMLIIITAYAAIEFYKNRNNRRPPPVREQPQRPNQQQPQQNKFQEAKKQEEQKQQGQEKQQKMIEEPEEPKVSLPNRIKAQILLKIFKGCQILFCFCLTFFPNWTIDMHLRMNAELIEKCKSRVEEYNPYIMGEKLKQQ